MDIIFYGTQGKKFETVLPKGATSGARHVGRLISFGGIINRIERVYRRHRKEGLSHTWMESYLKKVMVEHVSELMGMLYVLDEPSIGLHPKDNVKMLRTLRQLRDIGNSVIVVEHDEATMRAADHIIELGPGWGRHRLRHA